MMVDMDSSSLYVDQVGWLMVWELAATWHWFCIYQMKKGDLTKITHKIDTGIIIIVIITTKSMYNREKRDNSRPSGRL